MAIRIHPATKTSQKFTRRYASTAASAGDLCRPVAVSAAVRASSTSANPPGVMPVLPTAAPAP